MGQADKEANQGQTTDAPVFRLQKMYIKDLSFENPNAPDVFLAGNVEPKVELNLKVQNRKLEKAEDHWEVGIHITANITGGEDNKTMFIIEVEHSGIFVIKNIPEEHLPAVLAVECPMTLFPYTRQIMSQTSVDGGFMPFLMEPVNFMALYENAKKGKGGQKEQ